VSVTDAHNSTVNVGNYDYFDVTSIEPSSGPSAGGTVVTIHGHGFDNVKGVLFGLMPAGSVTVAGPPTLPATAPAGLGTVNVVVITGHAASRSAPALQFTYTGGPSGSSGIVEPTSGGDGDLYGLATQVNNYCATHDCFGY